MGAPLRDVRKGSRVGLALDRTRNLHLYIDGNQVGVVAAGVADPCYVMIDLYFSWRKVREHEGWVLQRTKWLIFFFFNLVYLCIH